MTDTLIKYKLSKASDQKKKLQLVINGPNKHQKTIQFGQAGASDYNKHHDKELQLRYIKRHQSERDKGFWQHNQANLRRPSYLSKHLLWGDTPNLDSNIRTVEKHLNIKIQH